MSETDIPHFETIRRRAILCGIGVLGGLSLWVLASGARDLLGGAALHLFAMAFAASFFAAILAAAGTLGLKQASAIAFGLACVGAVLFSTASLRFDHASDILDRGFLVAAYVILVTVPVPFLIAHFRRNIGESWQSYPALFQHSWNIVIRYIAAWLFTGLSWLLILLSHLLLDFVGIPLLDWIIDVDPLPAMLVGGFLGLGLAVADEYSNIVSPYVVLRLLRLFMPVMFVVLVVFLIGLAVGGTFDGFFGLHAPEILLTIIALSVSLISASIDQDDALGIQGIWMQRIARYMSLLLPALAVLAAYLLAKDIAQEYLRPEHVVSLIWVCVGFLYAFAYAGAVVRTQGWSDRLRWVNIRLALLLVGVMAITLNPLINPEKIATNKQIEGFVSGQIAADDLLIWEMSNSWGSAGHDGLAQLKALDSHPEADRLAELIQLATERNSAGQFRSARTEPDIEELRQTLLEVIEVRPSDAKIPEGLLAQANARAVKSWTRGCQNHEEDLPAGCVLILADLVPAIEGHEGLFLYSTSGGGVWSELFIRDTENGFKTINILSLPRFYSAYFEREDLRAALNGEFTVEPAGLNSIRLNGRELLPTD